MFGSDILDIAVGIALIYMSLSLFVTIINELIATFFQLRSKTLLQTISHMLNNTSEESEQTGLDTAFKKNGIFKVLHGKTLIRGTHKPPSYMRAATFASILAHVLRIDENSSDYKAEIQQQIDALPEGSTKENLKNLLNAAGADAASFKQEAEIWYNTVMERVSGWYHRKLKRITLLVSFVVVVAFNADTIFMVNKLSENKDARIALVKTAVNITNDEDFANYMRNLPTTDPSATRVLSTDTTTTDSTTVIHQVVRADTASQRLEALYAQLDSAYNRIAYIENVTGMGWTREGSCCASCDEADSQNNCFGNMGTGCWWLRFAGWLLTMLAISLGAPFWFDLLKKMVNIRGTGSTGDASEKPASSANTIRVKG